jgi:lysophospholipase L1-like esterase
MIGVVSDLVFQPGQRLVFIGDSITDAGRRNEAAPYGNGYVHLARAFLLARYPALELTIVNQGIGGNTIRDLDRRWEEDVIALQPDWLSIKIGINDVWRQVQGRREQAVLLDEYAATYDRLLRRTREATPARLILMEPYVIEQDRADPFRTIIDSYLPAVHRLARAYDAILVRTQDAFDEALGAQPAAFWANDRVHPHAPGHAVIARAFLRGVGYGDV